MNIQIQICAFTILCVLFFFHISRETVGFRGTRLYSRAMIANFACILLDISSLILISFTGGTDNLTSILIARCYLISLVLVFVFGFLYTCNDINTLQQHSWFILISSALICVLISVLILLLPISFYLDRKYAYSFGPSVTLAFTVCAMLIVGTFLLTVFFRKQMNPRRKTAVRVWMFLELVAGLVQFLFRDLLLIGFATSVGMMILFMELENPESEMDRTVDVFSTNVMHEYLRQLYEQKKAFCGLIIVNAGDWGISRSEERLILMEMAQFLKKLPKGKVFRGTGNDFAVIFPRKAYSEDIIRQVYDRFISNWQGKEIRSVIIAVPDSRIAATPDEVTKFYQLYRSRTENTDERLIYVNAAEAEKLQNVRIIQQEILSALEEDRIDVFYQPIYSFEKKRFISAEALARIRQADGNIMMPGVFIPVAEKTGLVEAIGSRVLEKVCAMLAEHPITEIGVEFIEVNLSVAQCENRWLAEDLSGIVKRFAISPKVLNLEITETSTIRHREVVLRNMEKLKQLGFVFSLDDFGTGESNLNYIVDMPVDVVKFDRSMTRDYFRNDKTKLVMNSIVDMIRNMDLKIVAEGIESKEQLDAMEKIGIDYIQGYYFSKPLPLSEFLTFIHKKNAATL